MAGSFPRFYGKKRGGRRTGSNTLANVGSCCFFGLALLIGCAALGAVFVQMTIPELRANRDFVEHRARLIDKGLDEQPAGGGSVYAPRFRLRFSLDGRTYSPWATYDVADLHDSDRVRGEALLREFEIGSDYTCWYDPRNPERVIVARGYTWFAWLMLLVPAPFIAVGGVGLFYTIWNWGKSAERRAMLAQRAARRRSLDEPAGTTQLPHVPGPGELTDSPGTTLAYRLPTAAPGWNLLGLLLISLIWNGVVAIFVVMAVESYRQDEPDWLTIGIVCPFALAGLSLLGFFVRRLFASSAVGPTIVEISRQPLYPGGEYEIFVSQAGRLNVHSLSVILVCEEEATYRQGTDARTAVRRVYEQEVFRREAFEIRGAAWQVRVPLCVPVGAMHSFRAEHNKIDWKLLIHAQFARRPALERSFLVHVHPVCAESHAA
ncbi:MAG TPA: DUF3592 domain-containing protein [Pirellulales bacterium]|nr:DUF3592 domain-containing protein [Pirellulales bacterium]